jgi:hypothetical protein
MILGWPTEPVLTKPFNTVLSLIIITLVSFLLPIGLSCAFSWTLICKTKKNFKNKIQILPEEETGCFQMFNVFRGNSRNVFGSSVAPMTVETLKVLESSISPNVNVSRSNSLNVDLLRPNSPNIDRSRSNSLNVDLLRPDSPNLVAVNSLNNDLLRSNSPAVLRPNSPNAVGANSPYIDLLRPNSPNFVGVNSPNTGISNSSNADLFRLNSPNSILSSSSPNVGFLSCSSRFCKVDSSSHKIQAVEESPQKVLQKFDSKDAEKLNKKDQFLLNDLQCISNHNRSTEPVQVAMKMFLSEKDNDSEIQPAAKHLENTKTSIDHYRETFEEKPISIKMTENKKATMESFELKDENEAVEFQVEAFSQETTLPFTLQVNNLDENFRPNFLHETALDVDSFSEEDDNCKAQILAAKRTLTTNAVLSTIFLVVFALMMICSTSNRRYYSVVVLTILKGALPIFTTIANFGTVQFVITQYWHYIESSQIIIYIKHLF